jgi:hypothetical protein
MFLCNIDRKVLCQYFDVDRKRLKLHETTNPSTCNTCFIVFYAWNRFVIWSLTLHCLILALHGTKKGVLYDQKSCKLQEFWVVILGGETHRTSGHGIMNGFPPFLHIFLVIISCRNGMVGKPFIIPCRDENMHRAHKKVPA